MPKPSLVTLALASALLAPLAAAQTYSGRLDRDDGALSTGEYRDAYEIPVRRGDRFSLVLSSGDFDPYLIATPPGAEQEDNDDCTSGDLEQACLDLTATADGTMRVLVTSFAPGATGRYRLVVTTPAGTSPR